MVDEKAAVVATFDLMEMYFTLTRHYGIITDNPYHVAQIVEVFNADWEARLGLRAYEGLLSSNSNSRYHMAQFIDTATERLDVQIRNTSTSFSNASGRRQLSAAASTASANGTSFDTFASLRTLTFGVKVRKQKNLRVHAKLIVDDNAHALVGSMNIDRSAFDLRRELGTMTDDSAIAERLKEVFDSEWDLSHHDGAPEPLDPSRHHEDDFPSCMSEIEAGPKKVSLIAWPPREAIDLIHC